MKIVFGNNTEVFPRTWCLPPIDINVDEMSIGDAEEAISVIQEVVRQYPKSVLTNDLREIVVARNLSCYGGGFSGTYWNECVVVSVGSEYVRYERRHIVGALHSEISSVLMRKYGFADQEWGSLNPEGFQYAGDAVKRSQRYGVVEPDAALWGNGFLCAYGMASVEEDVNTYAFWMWALNEELEKAERRSSRIRGKVRLLQRFYESLDGDWPWPWTMTKRP